MKAKLTRQDRNVAEDDIDYMKESRAAMLLDTPRLANLALWGALIFVVVALFWASRAPLDEVTRGDGRVIPSSQIQVIQSLEGGIVAEINVSEGDIVNAGQVLLKLDPTRFAASYDEGLARQMGLRAAIARLETEASDKRLIVFPPDVKRKRPDLTNSELQVYRSRKKALDEAVGGLRRSLRLAQEEYDITEPLVRQGIMSQIDLLKLERQINELRSKINEQQNNFRTKAVAELNQKQAELAGLSEALRANEDRVVRTTVKSPVRGTIKTLNVNTLGGVISPGSDILEIVPLDDTLLVEAQLRPSDIAFVRPGQKAVVKITAYDFSIYGGLVGWVEQISADTIVDERGDSFFRVNVRTDETELRSATKALPIIPGMTAQIDILTGQKTVLDYLLKPFTKARQSAMRER